uniref:Uncharacterized protein n=3 Tax=Oryza TaxID=4527 RepID=A0A0E0EKX1_9ORYZ
MYVQQRAIGIVPFSLQFCAVMLGVECIGQTHMLELSQQRLDRLSKKIFPSNQVIFELGHFGVSRHCDAIFEWSAPTAIGKET